SLSFLISSVVGACICKYRIICKNILILKIIQVNLGEKSFADNILMRNFADVGRLFYLASAHG
ncbi:MAG: hypothetical protein LIP08_07170, partial [Bacteroides sp.]|nr:hypothetical protein [Bacteroides sp.]